MKSIPKKVIAIIVVILIILGGIATYFFVWRTPSSSYAAALDQLTALSEINKAVGQHFTKVTNAGTITDDSVTNTISVSKQYNEALEALSRNPAVVNDGKVKAVYEKNVSLLTSFKRSLSNTAVSMELYLTILDNCSHMVSRLDKVTTVSTFNTVSMTCNDAVTKGVSAPDSPFTAQYLTDYTAYSAAYINAYREGIQAHDSQASQNKISSIGEKLSSLSKKDLNLTPVDISGAIQDIKDVVNSQKDALLR